MSIRRFLSRGFFVRTTMSSSESTKPRLAILDDYQEAAFKHADWSRVQALTQVRVFTSPFSNDPADRAKLIEELKPFEIICTMRERTRFPAEVLSQLPNLKLLTTTAMGNASIDIAAAREAGIVVSGTAYNPGGTNEHNWALLMTVARNLVREHNNTARGGAQWQTSVPTRLGYKTLGVLGLGNLGKSTANIGKAFNMNVQAWSPNLTKERADQAGVKFVASKEEFFATSDIVSIHMVLVPDTINLVAYKELSVMKPTAFLINTSRGPIINEADLVRALKEHKIQGAGLDVFNVEPLPLDHPLRTLDNVTLTPHVGYVDDDMYKVFWGETVDNILSYLGGTPKRVIAPRSRP